jgi:hypothetical protein
LGQSIKRYGIKIKTAEIHPIDQGEDQSGLQDQKGNTVERARLTLETNRMRPIAKPSTMTEKTGKILWVRMVSNLRSRGRTDPFRPGL